MNMNVKFFILALGLFLSVGCSKKQGALPHSLTGDDEVIEVEVEPVEDPGNQPVLPPPVANNGVFGGNWKGRVEAISMGSSSLCDSEFRISQDDVAFVLAYILYDCGNGDVLELDRAIRFGIDAQNQLIFEGAIVGKIEADLVHLNMDYEGTNMKLKLRADNEALKILEHTFTANGFEILEVKNQNLQKQN